MKIYALSTRVLCLVISAIMARKLAAAKHGFHSEGRGIANSSPDVFRISILSQIISLFLIFCLHIQLSVTTIFCTEKNKIMVVPDFGHGLLTTINKHNFSQLSINLEI